MSVALLLVLACSDIGLGTPVGSAPVPGSPRIMVEPRLLHLPSVLAGAPATQELSITNRGAGTLRATAVISGDASFAFEDSGGPRAAEVTVLPGEVVALAVAASPDGGLHQAEVVVTSNDPTRPEVVVPAYVRGLVPADAVRELTGGPGGDQGQLAELLCALRRGRPFLPREGAAEDPVGARG